MDKSNDFGARELATPDNREILRLTLIRECRLKMQTTLEQVCTWLKAKDFERHEPSLRHHFIDRLGTQLSHFSPTPQELQYLIGKPTFSADSTWSDIHAIILSILATDFGGALSDSYDELTESLGFPPDTYADLMECVEEGMSYEKTNVSGTTIH